MCGCAFVEEPPAISGMRAYDEMECGPCYEQEEADSGELEADIRYTYRRGTG
jgi:hypothetical protein